jgi:phosphopantetheine adenylyltransferase
MLKNKKHGDVMQPYRQRADTTNDFLKAINPSVTYEVRRRVVHIPPTVCNELKRVPHVCSTQLIEINDPYGPTLTGPTFNAIIASEETQKVHSPTHTHAPRMGLIVAIVVRRE